MVLPLSVTSEYTKKNLLEMQKLLHRRTAVICLRLVFIGPVLTAVGIALINGLLIVCGLMWTALFLITRNHAARSSAKQAYASSMKYYGKTVVTSVKFYNTLLWAHNETSGKELRAGYDEVKRLCRSRNLLIFVLMDNTAIMVDRRQLPAEDDRDLWELFEEKCTEAIIVDRGDK